MRIIGSIEHSEYKITVFRMDNRLSIKLENASAEQTYKFRAGDGMESMEDVRRLIDPVFLEKADQVFQQMQENVRSTLLRRQSVEDAEDFEEII